MVGSKLRVDSQRYHPNTRARTSSYVGDTVVASVVTLSLRPRKSTRSICFSFLAKIEGCGRETMYLPRDTRRPKTRCHHIQGHPHCDRSSDPAGSSVRYCIEDVHSYGSPLEIPSAIDTKLRDGIVRCERCQTYELLFQCWGVPLKVEVNDRPENPRAIVSLW